MKIYGRICLVEPEHPGEANVCSFALSRDSGDHHLLSSSTCNVGVDLGLLCVMCALLQVYLQLIYYNSYMFYHYPFES